MFFIAHVTNVLIIQNSMLVIFSDNMRTVMRKENHHIFILLKGITIRLGTDKKINQLHSAKREIRTVRTGTTKKSTVLA